MSTSLFQDPRASDLLSRVSEDVSLLKQDIRQLASHTARHTLPEGARSLADSARSRLTAGKTYSTEHLRALRQQMNQPATAWVGGAVAVGLIAAGVYWFCKDGCCSAACDGESNEN
jgi:hypothetical protein